MPIEKSKTGGATRRTRRGTETRNVLVLGASIAVVAFIIACTVLVAD